MSTTTNSTTLNLNTAILEQVADTAIADAAGHPRWVTAIGRALLELDSNPWIARSEYDHGLLIGSPSGAVYSANGLCQCEAYTYGQACWHRAAARLVRRHDEALERAGQVNCAEPDNGCSVEDPCIDHIELAAAHRGPLAPLSERLAFARKQMDELFN